MISVFISLGRPQEIFLCIVSYTRKMFLCIPRGCFPGKPLRRLLIKTSFFQTYAMFIYVKDEVTA